MKTILITGSSGLVGSAAVQLFEEKGWNVIGIDANMRSHFFGTPRKEVQFTIDIRNFVALEDIFVDNKFDAIIHAAGQPSHDYSTDHVFEDFEINARGTLNLLELTRIHCPDAVFVHVSTDKVYGENMKCELFETASRYERPLPEDRLFNDHPGDGFNEAIGLDFAGHRSFFGCSKAAADMYAQEYAHTFGMKVGIFRPGCITGKNHEGAEQHGFLAYLAKCIKEGKTYKIYGYKGKQVRDQIHANDLASAFSEFIERPHMGAVYNIGGGPDRSVSVLEAAKMISDRTGMQFIHTVEEARQGDRQWDVHDVSKFRNDYPKWDYQYSLSDIINDICEKI